MKKSNNVKLIFFLSIFISILLGRGTNCIAATSMKLEGYVYGERVLRVENRDPDDGLFADELDYQNKTLFEEEGNEIVKPDFTGKKYRVRYSWLHSVSNSIKKINHDKSVTYLTISKENTAKIMEKYLVGLKLARENIGTFVMTGDDVGNGQVSFWIWQKGNENKEVLPGKPRSRDAFSKITGYTLPNYTYDEALKSEGKMKEFINQFDKFDKEIWLAMQEIHAAHDKKTGKGSCKDSSGELYNININDNYKKKFQYNKTEINNYSAYYSLDREGLSSEKEKTYLRRCWAAKAVADEKGYPNVSTSNSLYVGIEDSYKVKMSYTKDQIWLYKQVYYNNTSGNNKTVKIDDVELGELSEKEKDILMIEWANMMSKGEHTSFYNKNLIHGSTGGETFSGATNLDYSKKDVQNAKNIIDGIYTVDTESAFENLKNASDNYRDTTSNYEYDSSDYIKAGSEDEHKDDPDKDTVFNQPEKNPATAGGVEDTINDADNFVKSGNLTFVDEKELQSFSQNMYGILLAIGVVIAVIIGTILGIKLMIAPIEERVEAKKLLVPYVVGCIVVFGAFGTWKLIVTIMQGL